MKRVLLAIFALFTLALTTTAQPVHAQDRPLWSMDRASIGVTANYAFFQNAGDQPLPAYKKAWELGAVGAYNLVAQPGGKAPLLNATFATSYDLDNRWWRHRVGLTLVIWKGND